MSAAEIVQKFTYDDYKEWEGRWELIDGEAYNMAPVPYPKHQRIVARCWRELSKNLNCIFKNACEVYISPIDWKIDEFNTVEPDVAVFCEKTDNQYFSTTPKLIVEVLSKGTVKKDTTIKFDLYESQKVPFYIIIEPEKEEVLIYRLEDEKYELVEHLKEKKEVELKNSECEFEIDFKEVF